MPYPQSIPTVSTTSGQEQLVLVRTACYTTPPPPDVQPGQQYLQATICETSPGALTSTGAVNFPTNTSLLSNKWVIGGIVAGTAAAIITAVLLSGGGKKYEQDMSVQTEKSTQTFNTLTQSQSATVAATAVKDGVTLLAPGSAHVIHTADLIQNRLWSSQTAPNQAYLSLFGSYQGTELANLKAIDAVVNEHSLAQQTSAVSGSLKEAYLNAALTQDKQVEPAR